MPKWMRNIDAFSCLLHISLKGPLIRVHFQINDALWGAEKSYIRLSLHCVSRPVSCTVCLCKRIMHPFTLHLKFSYYFSSWLFYYIISLLGELILYFWLLDSNLPSVFFQKRQWLCLQCKGFMNGSHFSLSLVLKKRVEDVRVLTRFGFLLIDTCSEAYCSASSFLLFNLTAGSIQRFKQLSSLTRAQAHAQVHS